MHTIPTSTEPTIADLTKVMIRIQIAALETMERCMRDTESSGDEKKDRAESTKLNRQRMAAAQTLTHCRTMFRELREAEAQQHCIAEEKKQSARKAIFDLASLRRLHKTYPGEYDNPDAASIASETNRVPETSRARQEAASSPSPPTDDQSGEGGDRSQIDRRMRERQEPSETSECGMLKQSLSMVPPDAQSHAQTSLSMPHKTPRTRYKARKPKHPRQSRKRKHKQRRG